MSLKSDLTKQVLRRQQAYQAELKEGAMPEETKEVKYNKKYYEELQDAASSLYGESVFLLASSDEKYSKSRSGFLSGYHVVKTQDSSGWYEKDKAPGQTTRSEVVYFDKKSLAHELEVASQILEVIADEKYGDLVKEGKTSKADVEKQVARDSKKFKTPVFSPAKRKLAAARMSAIRSYITSIRSIERYRADGISDSKSNREAEKKAQEQFIKRLIECSKIAGKHHIRDQEKENRQYNTAGL